MKCKRGIRRQNGWQRVVDRGAQGCLVIQQTASIHLKRQAVHARVLPEGSLMILPPDLSSLSWLRRRRRLGVGLVGLLITCWMMRMLSSRSSRSISRSFSSCSLFFSSSSWIFCCSAALVISSSLHRNSCRQVTENLHITRVSRLMVRRFSAPRFYGKLMINSSIFCSDTKSNKGVCKSME